MHANFYATEVAQDISYSHRFEAAHTHCNAKINSFGLLVKTRTQYTLKLGILKRMAVQSNPPCEPKYFTRFTTPLERSSGDARFPAVSPQLTPLAVDALRRFAPGVFAGCGKLAVGSPVGRHPPATNYLRLQPRRAGRAVGKQSAISNKRDLRVQEYRAPVQCGADPSCFCSPCRRYRSRRRPG